MVTQRDLIADALLPATTPPTEAARVIDTGRKEMRQYLDAVLPSDSQYREWLQAFHNLA